jgi:hypothetical protein
MGLEPEPFQKGGHGFGSSQKRAALLAKLLLVLPVQNVLLKNGMRALFEGLRAL